MQIDTGLAVVILAVLIFYLRLIILQRERARRLKAAPPTPAKKGKTAKSNKKQPTPEAPKYGILSSNTPDRVIGGIGAALVVIGLLLNAHLIPWPAGQAYWWIPTAAGIVMFSWLFHL